MSAFPIRTAVLTAVAAIGLSACMSPYGYGGVGVGYGGGYGGYGGYGDYYPGYGYAGYEPYGWYDGYYYPGTGYYVYDRYRRPHRWSDGHRDYWERRRENAMSSSEFRRQMEARRDQQNWSGFDQGPAQVQQIQRSDNRSQRIERSNRVQRIERGTSRSERGSTRSNSGKQSAKDFRRSMEDRN